MVIAIIHAIAFLILHKRNRFLANRYSSNQIETMTDFQEGLLKLSGVITYDEFEECLKEALTKTLPGVVDTVVYVQSQDGQDLVSTCGMLHAAPTDGVIGDCVTRKQRVLLDTLPASDPVCGLLSTMPVKRNKVICTPVIDSDNDKVMAICLAVCDPPSREDLQNLDFLEKQALVCYTRLKRTGQMENGPPTLSPISKHLNNNSSILKLCADLYDQDAPSLQIKVVRYLTQQTNAGLGFLLLIDRGHREMFCQVIGEKVLENEIRFPINDSSFRKVLETKKPITLDDINKKEYLESALGLKVDSMLCVPVLQKRTSDITAIACLMNKVGGASFSEADVEAVHYCFKFTATVLHSALAVQSERQLKDQTQALLQVAKNLFTHLDDLTVLLREIMQEARNLTKAERCSVFLVDKESEELVAKVFDGDIQEKQLQSEVTIPLSQGIAGHVATTGEILNIDDAYSHPLFYRGVDDSTGFKTRNILCFPIKNQTDEVIGVAQLCNKINAPGFSMFDVDIAQAFSVYCCISIVHSLMYKRVMNIQIRSNLANELMMYHMQIDPDNVSTFIRAVIPAPEGIASDFAKFSFTPRSVPLDDIPLAVLCMFEDMGFIQRFKIRKETLVKFVLMVRRGYRDPPYHNWIHAFSVAHFCYLMHKNANLKNYLSDLEVFSLFVACLCHDIDHRGTTNSYQVKSSSTLAALYSSQGSVLERHHFAQTMCILNTEECNILQNLNNEDYTQVLDSIRDIILATDVAHHLSIMTALETLSESGYSKENPEHRNLLVCLLMTSCDLSDQTKSWNTTKHVAELIYQEFFSQGDLEKQQGQMPMAMMDRESACIPELQIDFLNGIAQPAFTLLCKLVQEVAEILENVEQNKKNWIKMNKRAKTLKLGPSFDVLHVPIEDDDSGS